MAIYKSSIVKKSFTIMKTVTISTASSETTIMHNVGRQSYTQGSATSSWENAGNGITIVGRYSGLNTWLRSEEIIMVLFLES